MPVGLLAVLLAVGGNARAGDAVRPEELLLPVVFVNLSAVPSDVLRWCLLEAGELLRPASVRVTVEGAAPGTAIRPRALLVIALPGAGPVHHGRRVLGAVGPREQGAVWLHPDGVALALGLEPSLMGRWPMEHGLRFRRALSLVLVHELLHRLAAARHTPDGLMAGRLDRLRLFHEQRVDPALFGALRRSVDALGNDGGQPPLAAGAWSSAPLLPLRALRGGLLER
jgi:hypothetical protein